MKKRVLLSKGATKEYSKLQRPRRKQVKAALERLSRPESRYRLDVKRLIGVGGRETLFRLRVGDYRIIFLEEEKSIKVTQIIHREKGYSWI
ncbi:MAG: type II toxin-antitoxin system RelE/ParE family toxin [Methanobacteriota archaeon]|nr:MAG: type II toxin-antitoxin system RelE/ParE family toxin [Euryarchaeota archaeon]